MHDHSLVPSSLLRRALELSVLLVVVLALQGCDSTSMDSQAPQSEETAPFEVSFTTAVSGKSASATGKSVVISGSNGDLEIQDVHLIVTGALLKSVSTSGDAFEDAFEIDGAILDLPLDTSAVSVFHEERIPVGAYDELEFSVVDLDLDEDDDTTKARRLQQIVTRLQNSDFPNWRNGASMRVSGRFTPSNEARGKLFVTYFDAEIEVERTFTPPVEVRESGPGRTLTVSLSPDQWFTRNDGSVRNLAALRGGQLVEFDAKLEDGVSDIEFGDNDDDNENDDD